MDGVERGAARILANIEATYVPTHNFVEVSAHDFRHLNLRFYESVREELEQLGYRHIADLEDTTISNAPASVLTRIMIRSMLSADGTIMAGAYDPKLKLLWRIVLTLLRKAPGPVVDFETEYSNGSFLVTTNGQVASMINTPPMVMTEFLPARTSVATVLRVHLERMEALQASVPDATPKSLATQEDIRTSQNRMNALKAAYRKELGGISAEELARMSVGWSDVHRKMHERIQAIRSRRTSA